MATNKTLDLQTLGQQLSTFFSATVEGVARQSQFVRRSSPLSGLKFLQALVFGFLEQPQATLSSLAQVCLEMGVTITSQGLDERFSPFSVTFMQTMFAQACTLFKNRVPLPLPLLQQFTAINLVDSTHMTLPPQLQTEYPGCGGSASPASLKIQLVFEFLYGQFKQVALQAGRAPDQAYRDYLTVVEAGSLTIADLGYFCLDSLKTIAATGAYFLLRYHYPTGILTPSEMRVDVLAWLRAETAPHWERPVLLGAHAQHRVPCRLIAFRLPPAVAAERRRKALAAHRQAGRQAVGQDYLFLLGWNLFVTNVPPALLSIEQVATLYRIRWQIELLFKLWKSYCGLKAIGLWRRDRILTELYAKLLGSVLLYSLVAPLRIPEEQWSGRELSVVHAKKILARFATRLNSRLSDEVALVKVLHELVAQVLRFAFKQKRHKKPNACQRIALA